MLAQEEIFLSTLSGELYSLDLTDCDYQFVANMPISSTDISFHPNGNFYALGSAGQLYDIDLDNGTSQLIYTFEASASQLYTALTISAEGIFYASGLGGDLWRYSLDTGFGQLLGNIGFGAEGDLTFYEGELYMAATNDNIVRVNIQNPAQSFVAIDGSVSGRIFGIVSYAESCDSISVYALTNNAAVVYEVDLVNNELELYCSIPLQVSGGASTFEFLGSNPINIGEPEADDFSCDSSDGILDIPASGGVGALQYSLDGVNYQDSPVFTGLPLENYLVYVADEVGCIRTRPVSPNGGPLSADIAFSNTSCGFENGQITLTPIGGQGPYAIVMNDSLSRPDGVFNNLPAGTYGFLITDQSGCESFNAVIINGSEPLGVDSLIITPASCELANGAILPAERGSNLDYEVALNGTTLSGREALLNLPSGNYSLEFSNSDGCLANFEANIPGSPAVDIVVAEISPANCAASDGALQLITSGGTGALGLMVDNRAAATSGLVEGLAVGQYIFTVVDSLGCQDTTSVLLPSARCPLYIPNAFTPNLDGVNDYFETYSASAATTEIIHFRVFDRWGGLLFERLNGTIGDREFRWDGTRLGKKLSTGIYLYSIAFRFADGSTEEMSGEVNLLR